MRERKRPRHLPDSNLKAEQYRNRAAELSAISEETKDKNARETLQRLSADYLKMARQMDQITAINRQLHIEPKD
jgi:DNA-binding ferritin-like protein